MPDYQDKSVIAGAPANINVPTLICEVTIVDSSNPETVIAEYRDENAIRWPQEWALMSPETRDEIWSMIESLVITRKAGL